MNITHLIFMFQKMKRLCSIRGEFREKNLKAFPAVVPILLG